jgi:hypothetical protein
MRFPDGAIRPAYNAQIAAAPKEGVIVSIDVTDRRNDAGLAAPMVDDIARRYGRTPGKLLVDTSYATSEHIMALAAHAAGPVKVYTPPPSERDDVKPATLARRIRKRAKEPACLKAWRERMASQAGQAVYALRKRIERINADRKAPPNNASPHQDSSITARSPLSREKTIPSHARKRASPKRLIRLWIPAHRNGNDWL